MGKRGAQHGTKGKPPLKGRPAIGEIRRLTVGEATVLGLTRSCLIGRVRLPASLSNLGVSKWSALVLFQTAGTGGAWQQYVPLEEELDALEGYWQGAGVGGDIDPNLNLS